MGPKPSPGIDKRNELNGSAEELRRLIDTIPTLAWCSLADGSREFHNQRWQDFTGLSAEQSHGLGWTVAIHPDDAAKLMETRQAIIDAGIPGEVEARVRRFDGTYRWFLFRAEPLRDENGKPIKWCGVVTDIEDRKRAKGLLAGEKRVLEMVAGGNPLPLILDALCRIVEDLSSGPLCGILLVDAAGNRLEHGAAPSLPPDYNEAIHGRPMNLYAGPCGTAACLKKQVIVTDVASDTRWDASDWRTLALSHGLRACWSTPILSSDGGVLGTFAIYWREPRRPTEQHQRLLEQITHLAAVAIERERTEAALQESEERFRLIVDSIPGLVCTMTAAGEVELVNRQVLEYFGRTLEELKGWATTDAVHPDDLPRVIAAWRRSIEAGEPYDIQHRIRRADGVYRWFHVRGLALRDAQGRIVRWYLLEHDIDDRKKAEEKLRQDEEELRRMTDAIPQHIIVLAPDGTAVHANQSMLEYTGLTLEDVMAEDFRTRVFHPEDVERLRDERANALARGLPFENEQRVRHRDGRYRWTLIRYNPFRDEQGRVVRWYATGTDIHDRKEAEERTRNENLALREEIDRSSMFEEIVSSSEALRKVLIQVSKVAQTDSTVLILGETGTGKELIARAIHRQSNRADRAFIRVSCAAIPPSLIASELFGHEKGAFTGALQRRLGRFESADHGTIFLDEIGELPPETQIALLRVLQEREFERVGSNQPISVDVRILAATNRDLSAAVASGAFRRDLFYRLNVFPIQLPPLRERKTDIPLLAEYLIGRYAKTAGKSIWNISRQTIEMFQAYDWPGNVRELQNVLERAVILCEGDTLSVDGTWLKRETLGPASGDTAFASSLLDHEREMIEAALAQSRGIVAGPKGAAIKLGIPRQTLDSKIRSLRIDKRRFRAA
jgi:PAS domain S-box-containing protein